MAEQETFDRFQAFQHNTEWTVDATARDDPVIDSLIVSGFITSVAMKYLQKEFEHVYLSEDGLIIS